LQSRSSAKSSQASRSEMRAVLRTPAVTMRTERTDTMRILLDPGSYDFSNLGCVAVLQMAVRRLRALWPHASIQVLTDEPKELRWHCPEATPVLMSGHRSLLGDRLLGRFHRWLPAGLEGAVRRMDDALRERWPDVRERAARIKLGLQRRSTGALDAFCESLESADLVVVSGLAGIRGSEIHALETLELAIYRRKPTAMFSLGLGGPHDAELARRMARVLPRVNLIALRERRTGLRVLRQLGVEKPEIAVMGDDSVEMAKERRAPELGDFLGVTLRVGRSSEIGEPVVEEVAQVLRAAADRLGTRLVPLPTARGITRPDAEVGELIVRGCSAPTRHESLDTPSAVMDEVKRCRIVVSGAYHVAVFALAQGIPTVGVAQSAYFRDKLECLADLFGPGCVVLTPGQERFRESLRGAVDELWSRATSLRPGLLAQAEKQCEAARSAYGRLPQLVDRFEPSRFRGQA
jgi:polysaccharide pyruvyl transferase WcaK-like protein